MHIISHTHYNQKNNPLSFIGTKGHQQGKNTNFDLAKTSITTAKWMQTEKEMDRGSDKPLCQSHETDKEIAAISVGRQSRKNQKERSAEKEKELRPPRLCYRKPREVKPDQLQKAVISVKKRGIALNFASFKKPGQAAGKPATAVAGSCQSLLR